MSDLVTHWKKFFTVPKYKDLNHSEKLQIEIFEHDYHSLPGLEYFSGRYSPSEEGRTIVKKPSSPQQSIFQAFHSNWGAQSIPCFSSRVRIDEGNKHNGFLTTFEGNLSEGLDFPELEFFYEQTFGTLESFLKNPELIYSKKFTKNSFFLLQDFFIKFQSQFFQVKTVDEAPTGPSVQVQPTGQKASTAVMGAVKGATGAANLVNKKWKSIPLETTFINWNPMRFSSSRRPLDFVCFRKNAEDKSFLEASHFSISPLKTEAPRGLLPTEAVDHDIAEIGSQSALRLARAVMKKAQQRLEKLIPKLPHITTNSKTVRDSTVFSIAGEAFTVSDQLTPTRRTQRKARWYGRGWGEPIPRAIGGYFAEKFDQNSSRQNLFGIRGWKDYYGKIFVPSFESKYRYNFGYHWGRETVINAPSPGKKSTENPLFSPLDYVSSEWDSYKSFALFQVSPQLNYEQYKVFQALFELKELPSTFTVSGAETQMVFHEQRKRFLESRVFIEFPTRSAFAGAHQYLFEPNSSVDVGNGNFANLESNLTDSNFSDEEFIHSIRQRGQEISQANLPSIFPSFAWRAKTSEQNSFALRQVGKRPWVTVVGGKVRRAKLQTKTQSLANRQGVLVESTKLFAAVPWRVQKVLSSLRIYALFGWSSLKWLPLYPLRRRGRLEINTSVFVREDNIAASTTHKAFGGLQVNGTAGTAMREGFVEANKVGSGPTEGIAFGKTLGKQTASVETFGEIAQKQSFRAKQSQTSPVFENERELSRGHDPTSLGAGLEIQSHHLNFLGKTSPLTALSRMLHRPNRDAQTVGHKHPTKLGIATAQITSESGKRNRRSGLALCDLEKRLNIPGFANFEQHKENARKTLEDFEKTKPQLPQEGFLDSRYSSVESTQQSWVGTSWTAFQGVAKLSDSKYALAKPYLLVSGIAQKLTRPKNQASKAINFFDSLGVSLPSAHPGFAQNLVNSLDLSTPRKVKSLLERELKKPYKVGRHSTDFLSPGNPFNSSKRFERSRIFDRNEILQEFENILGSGNWFAERRISSEFLSQENKFHNFFAFLESSPLELKVENRLLKRFDTLFFNPFFQCFISRFKKARLPEQQLNPFHGFRKASPLTTNGFARGLETPQVQQQEWSGVQQSSIPLFRKPSIIGQPLRPTAWNFSPRGIIREGDPLYNWLPSEQMMQRLIKLLGNANLGTNGPEMLLSQQPFEILRLKKGKTQVYTGTFKKLLEGKELSPLDKKGKPKNRKSGQGEKEGTRFALSSFHRQLQSLLFQKQSSRGFKQYHCEEGATILTQHHLWGNQNPMTAGIAVSRESGPSNGTGSEADPFHGFRTGSNSAEQGNAVLGGLKATPESVLQNSFVHEPEYHLNHIFDLKSPDDFGPWKRWPEFAKFFLYNGGPTLKKYFRSENWPKTALMLRKRIRRSDPSVVFTKKISKIFETPKYMGISREKWKTFLFAKPNRTKAGLIKDKLNAYFREQRILLLAEEKRLAKEIRSSERERQNEHYDWSLFDSKEPERFREYEKQRDKAFKEYKNSYRKRQKALEKIAAQTRKANEKKQQPTKLVVKVPEEEVSAAKEEKFFSDEELFEEFVKFHYKAYIKLMKSNSISDEEYDNLLQQKDVEIENAKKIEASKAKRRTMRANLVYIDSVNIEKVFEQFPFSPDDIGWSTDETEKFSNTLSNPLWRNFLIHEMFRRNSMRDQQTLLKKDLVWEDFVTYHTSPLDVSSLRQNPITSPSTRGCLSRMNALVDFDHAIKRYDLTTRKADKKKADQYYQRFDEYVKALGVPTAFGRENVEKNPNFPVKKRTRKIADKKRLVKQYRAVLTLLKNPSCIERGVFDKFPILPPDLRPILQLGDVKAVSDMTALYILLIQRNIRHGKILFESYGESNEFLIDSKTMVQVAADNALDKCREKNVNNLIVGRMWDYKDSQNQMEQWASAKPKTKGPGALVGANAPRTLYDRLSGKEGRFRMNLLGKRVDYSGRSVIIVGPSLKVDQCGLPYEMAFELFQPFVLRYMLEDPEKKVQKYLQYDPWIPDDTILDHLKWDDANKKVTEESGQKTGLDPRIFGSASIKSLSQAKLILRKKKALGRMILRQIVPRFPVLLNRAPTLHRLGIQGFHPVLVYGRALHLHPLVCGSFNADFDGDQMAVHIPLSLKARFDIRMLMFAPVNWLSPATGQPTVVPSQDMVLGLFYMTLEKIALQKGRGAFFQTLSDAVQAYQTGMLEIQSQIWVKWNGPFANNRMNDESSEEVYEEPKNRNSQFRRKPFFPENQIEFWKERKANGTLEIGVRQPTVMRFWSLRPGSESITAPTQILSKNDLVLLREKFHAPTFGTAGEMTVVARWWHDFGDSRVFSSALNRGNISTGTRGALKLGSSGIRREGNKQFEDSSSLTRPSKPKIQWIKGSGVSYRSVKESWFETSRRQKRRRQSGPVKYARKAGFFYHSFGRFSNDEDEPLEIRVHQTGNSRKIYADFQWSEDSKEENRVCYIRTTPGRALMNQLIYPSYEEHDDESFRKNVKPTSLG